MGRGGLYIAIWHVLLSWEQHQDIQYNHGTTSPFDFVFLTAFFLPGALSASSMAACFKQLLHVITVLFLYDIYYLDRSSHFILNFVLLRSLTAHAQVYVKQKKHIIMVPNVMRLEYRAPTWNSYMFWWTCYMSRLIMLQCAYFFRED